MVEGVQQGPVLVETFFSGAHTSWCIHKAVHTQAGGHKRRCVATAAVLLFKGPQARRCT